MYSTEFEKEIDKEGLEAAVRRFQKGDESAFDIIYKNVAKTAFILVNSFFPDEKSEHEDIVQDIFIHTYKKIRLYDPKLSAFTTWFHKVAENKCIDRYRALKKKEKQLHVVSMESLAVDEDGKKSVDFADERIEFNPAARMERNEVSRLLRELMEQLPEGQKQCLLLKFLAHYDIREIAEKLNIPVGTVKSRLSKGKENLSAEVYAMEKQGVRLYSMSPLAFFLFLFLYDCEAQAASHTGLQLLKNHISDTHGTEKIQKTVPSNTAGTVGVIDVSFTDEVVETITNITKINFEKSVIKKCMIVLLSMCMLGFSGFLYSMLPEEEPSIVSEKAGEDSRKLQNDAPESKSEENVLSETAQTEDLIVDTSVLIGNPVTGNETLKQDSASNWEAAENTSSSFTEGQMNPETLENGNNQGTTAIPGNPAVPETPETPEAPVVPDTPTQPEIPNVPDIPAEPDTPTIPDVPAEPETPDVPTEPDTPAEPEIPVDPETPQEPDPPTEPEVPQEPDIPTEPDVPTEPEIPQEPDVPPTEPETPQEPDVPPTEPETPQEPEPPTEPEIPENPNPPDEKPLEYGDYSVSVVNGADGSKIANAKLEILKDGVVIRTLYTDANGTVSDTKLEEGTYDIRITADQFLPYKGTFVITANQIINIDATLERAAGACQIGDKYYLTVGEAIRNAKTGDTIVVMTNSTEDKPLVVPKEKQLTIMSEYPVNITRKETSLDDMLTNHGTLTIHGPVNFHYSSSGNTLLQNYGAVTLSSGVTFTSHYSHGEVVRNRGQLILEGNGDEYQCIIKGIGQNSNFGLWNEGTVQTNNCNFLIQDVSYGIVREGNSTDDISTNYHYTNVGQPFYGI